LTLRSEVHERLWRLPYAQTRALRHLWRLSAAKTLLLKVERDLEVPMDDGVVLLADRFAPRGGGPRPTVLVRSPYGRQGVFGLIYGRLFAEQGLQVLVQSVRGTFGSQGQFNAFDERADGLATIAWIKRQPWHTGKIGMVGASYLGYVQWAVAREAAADLGALAPTATASQFYGSCHSGGLALEANLSWMFIMATQEQRLGLMRAALALRQMRPLFDHVPLADLEARMHGQSDPFFQKAFECAGADDPYWVARDFSADVAEVVAPVQLVTGWHDLFTPWQIEDFVALRRAGHHDAQLVVGPWSHTSSGLMGASVRQAIAWMRAHLLGDRRQVHDAPVRVYVGGQKRWRELPDWPPPGAREFRLYLQPDGRLAPEPPDLSSPDRFHYDPADPTPSVGGPSLLERNAVVDNRLLEARHDVLTYTTPMLRDPLLVMGPVSAEVHFRSSAEHFDVFVRVCDVDRSDVSRNVCDALVRATPGRFQRGPDGVTHVVFSLWPTAHQFAAGHRLRVQVSSGAHPRYVRNPGTGDPPATATRLVSAQQEVFHDREHPSAIVLSVLPA
jgi:uncharacterized protein